MRWRAIRTTGPRPSHSRRRSGASPDDRPGLGVDPDAQSLAGWGGRLWLNKQQGAFLFNSAFGALSSGYNNNDLGFQFGGDIMNGHIGMGHQWEKPNSWPRCA